MFLDIAPSEFLLTAVVAVVVIGPKDLPMALRTAGKWMGKMRRMSNHFRSGVEEMIRQAEMAEMEKQWREQNAAIMAQYPEAGAPPLPAEPPAEAVATTPAPAAPPAMEPLVAAAPEAVAPPPAPRKPRARKAPKG
jgi:sec-independent protein translocase protein TatB